MHVARTRSSALFARMAQRPQKYQIASRLPGRGNQRNAMTTCGPPATPAGTITPAEREALWNLFVRFAIEAATEDEAHAVFGEVLAGLARSRGGWGRDLPLRGEPVIRPRHRRHPDDIWIAEVTPDLTELRVIDPDDAKTRCELVHGFFGYAGGVWSVPLNTDRKATREWPTLIWNRQPGRDDELLHPA